MSFTKLDPTDFVVSADSVTAPAWSTNKPKLETSEMVIYTSPDPVTISTFYLDVYQTTPGTSDAAVQFSIAYGNYQGLGSAPFNPLLPGISPSLVTYKQYKNLIYANPSIQKFYDSTGATFDDIIAISIDRNRYKESLMPGTSIIHFNGLELTDNSNDVTTITYLDCGRKFDIVAGTYGKATNPATPPYGMFLPDIGVIILYPSRVGYSANTGTTTNLVNEKAIKTLFDNYFQLNSQETISSNYAFVRIRNNEYNYTSNPSFVSGSGNLVYSNFIYNPQTYITGVGLYNDNNELLAVAKMSRPLVKDFTKEALIRVKLDW